MRLWYTISSWAWRDITVGMKDVKNIDAVSPHVKKRVATRAPSLIAGSSRSRRAVVTVVWEKTG